MINDIQPTAPGDADVFAAEIVESEQQLRRARWRLLSAIGLLVVLADLTVYRGQGFAGIGALFIVAPWLIWFGVRRPPRIATSLVVGGMILLLGLKLMWLGYALPVLLGLGLLGGFVLALTGRQPYVLESIVFAAQSMLNGYAGWVEQYRGARGWGLPIRFRGLLNVVLPLAAMSVFGFIFLLANPDLFDTFGERMQVWLRSTQQWFLSQAPSPFEFLFCAAIAWIAMGVLRPVATAPLFRLAEHATRPDSTGKPAEFYAPFRNTLAALIALFAVYLVFEFKTLWFRDFPDGFYYAGYAHEGAAWLTVALALATLTLSLIFRGRILGDGRLGSLRRLAWIWSAQNFVLALAVYNRLFIYIGFNGMTRMRMIGLFGISAVVAGFVLVLIKIARNRGFVWLVRRQLWALAATCYIFALTPIDMIVVRYNVSCILSGDRAPAVQLIMHPVSVEGAPFLRPLLKCEDKTIREGARALLAKHDHEAAQRIESGRELGWTARQWADGWAANAFRSQRGQWSDLADDPIRREAALETYREYAYQWY